MEAFSPAVGISTVHEDDRPNKGTPQASTHSEASSRTPQSLRPLDIVVQGLWPRRGSVEGTFCFILEGAHQWGQVRNGAHKL